MASSKKHNASFLKTIFGHLSEAIIIADKNQIISYLNPAAIRILGTGQDTFIGKNLTSEFRLTNSVGRKVLKEQVSKLLKGRESISSVLFFEKSAKKKIALNTTLLCERNAQGTISQIILKFSEAAREADLLQHLRESERKYRGLFENAQEGILIFNNDAEIIDYNPSASEIYGKKKFQGLTIPDLFPHNTDAQNKKFWNDFLLQGSISGFYKYVRPDNNTRYIEFKARANYLPDLHLAVFTDVTDKRMTEKALMSSEANLKAVFDSSEQNIILIDNNMKVLAANVKVVETVKRVLGKSLTIGGNIMDIIVNKEEFISEYGRARKGEKVRVERNIKGLKGEDNWGEFMFVPIKDAKGNVISICYTVTEINNRKQKEFILAESERKFRSLSENSPDIIYIIDLKLRKVTYFNRDNILGYSSRNLITSESWIEIVYPGDYKKVTDYWQKFLTTRNNKTGSIEYRIKRKEGDYEWVSNRHIVIERDDKGSPSKVLLNITIITDQIKAQEALIESEAKLTALIENTTDLVWSIDDNFTLTAANTSFKELVLVNYKKKIKDGDNLYTKLPSMKQDGWLVLHRTALKGKPVSAEFSWKSSTNENRFYEISYNPIYDQENMICGVSVFARDITQRKTNEATILQTNFELDSFVYRASHDLRAPLRSILGLVNILNTETGEADRIKYLKLIEKSTIKLDNFISDLINFSRNSRASVDIDVVDFESIVSECRENLRYMDNADKVSCTVKIKGTQDFYSDSKRIAIFLNNLLSNAIKYQNQKQSKRFVHIDVTINTTHAVITIKDNGVGIRKEYLPKIFNMFFRASENSFGSGLGLYIARQAIERLGGKVKVDSKLGKGTTFTITLPNLEDRINDFLM